jgi:hypothetical protein
LLVVPGDPDASLLIRAIRYADPDLQMPPKKALATAHTAPTVVPRSTDVTATNRDHVVPWTIRLSTSRPMKSVPSQCCQLGAWALARTLGRRGSSGDTHGARRPSKIMSAATMPDTVGNG